MKVVGREEGQASETSCVTDRACKVYMHAAAPVCTDDIGSCFDFIHFLIFFPQVVTLLCTIPYSYVMLFKSYSHLVITQYFRDLMPFRPKKFTEDSNRCTVFIFIFKQSVRLEASRFFEMPSTISPSTQRNIPKHSKLH